MNEIGLPPLSEHPENWHNWTPREAAAVMEYASNAVRLNCAERDSRIAELEAQLAGGQEPVAWTILFDGHYVGNNFTYENLAVEKMRSLNISHPNEARCVVPLYLHPTAPLSDEHPYTYASTQATKCAGCGKYKHTPLRVDAMGGYVCLTCIDQKLGEVLGEFGYPSPQKPLSTDQVNQMLQMVGYDAASEIARADFINGIRHAEAAHGIKGDKP